MGAHHRKLDLFFQIAQRNAHTSAIELRDYRYRIPIAQLTHICRIPDIQGRAAFAIPLQSPPLCYRKLQNPVSTFSGSDTRWNSRDTWYRQTDIVANPRDLVSLPITLNKPRAMIDIGKCAPFSVWQYGD